MTKLNQLLNLPRMQLNLSPTLHNVLSQFNLWYSFKGITMSNLSNNYSLIWLRVLMPILDWRFDIKFCLESWTLLILWTVDGHTWVMKLLISWSNPSKLALCVYRLLKHLSLHADHPQLFAPFLTLIN